MRSDIDRFFERLVTPPGQLLEVRVVVTDGRGARQHFAGNTIDAISVVDRWTGRANVYVGACPRGERCGDRSSIRFATATWADLDFHQIDAADRERAEQIAGERIARFPHRPSMLVHTGNGLQSWWLFNEPLALSEVWPAERFESINRGIARELGGDAVHDLARVLRVPGTWNLPTEKKRERGCVRVMARLLVADGPTYSPDSFARLEVAAEQVARIDARRPLPKVPEPDQDVLEAFSDLLTALGPAHPLVRTWRGQRLPRDRSRSGWDWALVRQLSSVEMKKTYIPTILRAFPFGRGVFASDSYIARTLEKAHAALRGSHAQERSTGT